jgi:hypothetical protein
MAITVQSTYSSSIAAGYAGMVKNGETSNRISRTIEDAAGIAFGKAAFRGTGDHGVTGTAGAATFMGVAIADAGQVPGVGGTADTVPQYGTVGLLLEGVIYVSVGVAVNDGDQAYVDASKNITNVSAGGTAIPAKFDATTAGAGIVPLRVFSDRT